MPPRLISIHGCRLWRCTQRCERGGRLLGVFTIRPMAFNISCGGIENYCGDMGLFRPLTRERKRLLLEHPCVHRRVPGGRLLMYRVMRTGRRWRCVRGSLFGRCTLRSGLRRFWGAVQGCLRRVLRGGATWTRWHGIAPIEVDACGGPGGFFQTGWRVRTLRGSNLFASSCSHRIADWTPGRAASSLG
jgi:hypothetical protein